MAWVALDDQIFNNKKVARCDSGAKLLYIAGLVYCGNQLTDGFIHYDILPLLAGWTGTDLANAKQNASKLVAIELWEALADSWRIPDYLDYNPSREEVLHKKAVRKAAGKLGGQAKSSKRLANAKQNASKIVAPSPSPSPSPSGGGMGAPQPIDAEWAQALQGFEANIGKVGSGYTLQEMQQVFDELRCAGRADWWTKAVDETVRLQGNSWTYMSRVLENAVKRDAAPGSKPARAARSNGQGSWGGKTLSEILESNNGN